MQPQPLHPDLRAAYAAVESALGHAGGQAWLVGGSVRDALLGRDVTDLDVEVYGLPPDRIRTALASRFRVIEVGRSFGVFKLRDHPIDVALPRRERKEGTGHKGFLVEGDPGMSPEEACGRRDFTVNAILWNPLSGEIRDPFDGRGDLERGILRHPTERFAEDPLRVLRAMQFAARLRFAVAPETIALCRRIFPEEISRERVFEEWKKLILQGLEPSRGLRFLVDCGWILFYPELAALLCCPQDPSWHPEGDVWTHTLHCLDAFAEERTGNETEDLVVGLAVLCHDLGKPETTRYEREHIRSPEHEPLGVHPTRRFLERMTAQADLIEEIAILVANHLRPSELYKAGSSDAAVRRLARKVGRLDRLCRVVRADMRGRPPLVETEFAAIHWLLERAAALQVEESAPQPIIRGRHLIELGEKPGRHFGPILDRVFERQLEGEFDDVDKGMAVLRDELARTS